MPALRLKGSTLALVRSLTALGPFRSLLWRVAASDFGVDQVHAFTPDAKGPFEDTCRPLAGAPSHEWSDAGLPIPEASRPTAAALHEAFRSGRTTPRRLIEAWLAHVARGDFGEATHSPFSALDPERMRREAEESTARYAEGHPLGVLDGIPVPVKDHVDVARVITRTGTSYVDLVPETDAWVIERLRAAGAIIGAKTHAAEWGLNPWGCNQHHDFPRNVHSHDHGAGGSSTGSGVAVGLGLAPVALGSDGGGSVRIPACLNGVFGLKPSFLRIGRTGDLWGSGTMGHLGPIGGTVADCVAFLAATTAVDPDDPSTHVAPDGQQVATAWRNALGRGVKGCRIGVVASEWADAQPEVAAAGQAALRALAAEGAVLVDLELPLARFAPTAGGLLIASEQAVSLADDFAVHGSYYGHELTILLRMMGQLSGQELYACARVRSGLRRQVAAAFADRIDLLALPTTARPAVPYGLDEAGTDILWPEATAAMIRFNFLGNLLGLPAGTVPVGRVGDLPVGLQLVGDAWDEASVIAAMAHAERVGLGAIAPEKGFVDLLALAER